MFQTEIGKERALAEQSINVLGKHLVMSRIDCPRTTVARITSRELLEIDAVVSICKSLGDFSSSSVRSPYIIDVQFKVAEWPNMWKILNRYTHTHTHTLWKTMRFDSFFDLQIKWMHSER